MVGTSNQKSRLPMILQQVFSAFDLRSCEASKNSRLEVFATGVTLPETNSSPMKITIFPGKYHQKGGFSMGYVSLQGGYRF